jgi:N-acetylglutamate synthase-like GNAT family acetyltransferase
MVDSPDDLSAEIVAYTIEHGSPADAGRLREVERAAGARFRDIAMADIAEGEPTPESILEDRARNGQLLVARDSTGVGVGFLIWSPKDGMAYLEEVSVHPDHAGHRLASRLIDRLSADLRGMFPALTLATFRNVAWNAPYYAKLGFKEIANDKLGPDHAESWCRQAANGLDMTTRLFMAREIGE